VPGFYAATYLPKTAPGGEIIGMLAFIRDTTEENQQRLKAEQLYTFGRKQHQLADVLGRIILATSVLPGLPALLELICQEAAAFLAMDSAQIWLLEEEGLVGTAASGVDQKPLDGLQISLTEVDHVSSQKTGANFRSLR
jgi:hypothetical protein